MGTPEGLLRHAHLGCDTVRSWDDYFVRWDRLHQNSFGTAAHFDPTRLLGVTFGVSASLPADFWIDDLELVPPTERAVSRGSRCDACTRLLRRSAVVGHACESQTSQGKVRNAAALAARGLWGSCGLV
jgi:hypothetical protein